MIPPELVRPQPETKPDLVIKMVMNMIIITMLMMMISTYWWLVCPAKVLNGLEFAAENYPPWNIFSARS